jgi:hypothetical protein
MLAVLFQLDEPNKNGHSKDRVFNEAYVERRISDEGKRTKAG